MQEVSVFDAKNKLSALLDEVERGGEIAITRRGKVIAKLVPAAAVKRPEAAAERLRALRRTIGARGVAFSWEELKRYRDDGRE
jgi:prevent-host-death family protein